MQAFEFHTYDICTLTVRVFVAVSVAHRRWRLQFKTTTKRNAKHIFLCIYHRSVCASTMKRTTYRISARQLGDTEIIKMLTVAMHDRDDDSRESETNKRTKIMKHFRCRENKQTRTLVVYGTAFNAGTRLGWTHFGHRSYEIHSFSIFYWVYLLHLSYFLAVLRVWHHSVCFVVANFIISFRSVWRTPFYFLLRSCEYILATSK